MSGETARLDDPSEAMIDAGERAIDDFYSGGKTDDIRGSIRACYLAMIRLRPSIPNATEAEIFWQYLVDMGGSKRPDRVRAIAERDAATRRDARRDALEEAAKIADAREQQQDNDNGAANTGGAFEAAADIRRAAQQPCPARMEE